MIDEHSSRASPPVMQTKSPFSCRDRSPSDANVTGLNNRRDARGVRNNRRVWSALRGLVQTILKYWHHRAIYPK